MDLVILAAGMGSRFGGLKQIEPINNNSEFIIDYSIYDAYLFGFDRVIFIIKEENYEVFKNSIGDRIKNKVEVVYAFQNNDNINKYISVPEDRVKPFGTAHALLCAKDFIKNDFLIINADDFYGREAYRDAQKFAINNKDNSYCNVAYKVSNTLSLNGSVKRGICEVSDGNIVKLNECKIKLEDGNILATLIDEDNWKVIPKDTYVSMNMIYLRKDIIKYIEDELPKFLENNKNNLDNCEFLLTDVLNDLIVSNKISMKLVKTDAKYFGMTYKEDMIDCKNNIIKLTNDNIYPSRLWE